MAEPSDNSVRRQNLCGRLQLYCPPSLQIPEHQVTQSHHTDARGGVSIDEYRTYTVPGRFVWFKDLLEFLVVQ